MALALTLLVLQQVLGRLPSVCPGDGVQDMEAITLHCRYWLSACGPGIFLSPLARSCQKLARRLQSAVHLFLERKEAWRPWPCIGIDRHAVKTVLQRNAPHIGAAGQGLNR